MFNLNNDRPNRNSRNLVVGNTKRIYAILSLMMFVVAGTYAQRADIHGGLGAFLSTSNIDMARLILADNSTLATDDYNNTAYEIPVLGNVGVNDSDAEGDNQSFALNGVNGGMNTAEGTVVFDAAGTYTFTPAVGFSGTTSFEYEVCDDAVIQACTIATVYIEIVPEITPEGQPVIANIDANTVGLNQTATGNVISNDLDPDGATLSISNPITNTTLSGTDKDGNPVANAGTLTLNTNGTYTFIPTLDFVGTANYPYTACNDEPISECNNAILIIDVLSSDANATFANDDAVITDAGTPVNGDISENDYDTEGNNQTITSYDYDSDGDGVCDTPGLINGTTTISGTTYGGAFMFVAGTLELNDNGTYVFIPSSDFTGNAIVTYTVCDNNGTQACDNATLIITVLDANRDYGDAPNGYPIVWHRSIGDTNGDRILDGSSNVWLGNNTDFETAQKTSAIANGDSYDDGMSFGEGGGKFPIEVLPSQNFDLTIRLNGEQANDEVFYGIWIDWDDDATYDSFYNGSGIVNGMVDATVNITVPAGINGTEIINVRLRVDDRSFSIGDAGGSRTNGEVEDYQAFVVLPVELVSFEGKANDCDAQLNWVSASEEDFDRYEIEWSNDAENWKTVEVVYGAGGISVQEYEYLHTETTAVNYYRLKMVDLDETYEYSEVINIITDCSKVTELTLYPNPVKTTRGNVSVKFYSNTEMEELVMITDMMGRTVKQFQITVNEDWNTFDANINGLAKGSYILRMGNSEIAKMFVISK